MSDKKRGCVLKTQYYDPTAKNRNFFNGANQYNWFTYVTRQHTNFKENDYDNHPTSDPNKKFEVFNMYDKQLSNDDIKNLRHRLSSSESVIWDNIISFKGDEDIFNVENEQHFHELLMKHFKVESDLLKANNIEFVFCIHTDTEHPHAHILMWEKKPMTFDSKGNIGYTKKGKLPLDTIQRIQKNIDNDLINRYKELYPLRNILINNTKEAIKEDELKKDLLRLAKKLPANGRLSYNSDNMKELKPEVNAIVNKLIFSSAENKKCFDEIKRCANMRQELLNTTNHPDKEYNKNLINDLYGRLGNIVINEAKQLKYEQDKFDKQSQVMKQRRLKGQLQGARMIFGGILRALCKTCDDNINKELNIFLSKLREKETENTQKQRG